MSVSLENIDLLRERTNATYEEAKTALEACNNDVVEALIYLEKQKKADTAQKTKLEGSFVDTVKQLVKKGNDTKFVVEKQDNTVVNVPLNAAIASTVFFAPLTVVGVGVALLTHHSIKLEKPNGENVDVNEALNKMSTVVTEKTEEIIENIKKSE